MKRYVSLAGAMLLGSVIAQAKASALKTDIAAKAQNVELKEAAPAALEARRAYRSDVSAQSIDSITSRRSSNTTVRRSSNTTKKEDSSSF